MKLNTKITLGFTSVLLLMIITSGLGVFSIKGLLTDNHEVVQADNLRTALIRARQSQFARAFVVFHSFPNALQMTFRL